MKMRKLSKAVISLLLAVCLAASTFCSLSFAYTEALRYDAMAAYTGGGFYIFHMDRKYVKQGDKVTILARRFENGQGVYVSLPESDFLVKKEKDDPVEYFVIYVKDLYTDNNIHIGANSFFDAEGNGNEEINPPINGSTYTNITENMFTFMKHEGPFYDVNIDAELKQGDSIRVELHGTRRSDYKMYLDGKLISTGKEKFDVKFNEAGQHVLKAYLNEVIQDERTFNITDSGSADKERMEAGFAQMFDSVKLFPAGILLSLNPITMIMGGAILGGFWEGLWNIICSLFGW